MKISRTCMMPQDQTPGVDICMSEWQDLFCTQHLEENNLIQVFAFAGTEVKNANEIVFQQDRAPPHFNKDLTFSESHITWSVESKCSTNKVSQRIPCTSGIFVTCERKLMLLWWQLMVTCCVILVIKLVYCMSSALQTVLTLTVAVGARQLWEIFCILRKYFILCHTSWPVPSWMTRYCIHAAFKSNHNHCTIVTLHSNLCYTLQLDLLFEVSGLCPLLNVFRSFLPKFLTFFSCLFVIPKLCPNKMQAQMLL